MLDAPVAGQRISAHSEQSPQNGSTWPEVTQAIKTAGTMRRFGTGKRRGTRPRRAARETS